MRVGSRPDPGSAHPRNANKTTLRPCLRAASATANGKLPAPQTIASGASWDRAPLDMPSLMHGGRLRAVAATGARRHHGRTRSARAQKRNDLADQWIGPMLRRHRREPVAKFAAAEEQRAVALPQAMHVGAPVAAALETDHVEADQNGLGAERKPERNDIAGDSAQAPDHGTFADAHELVHGGLPAQKRTIADADMAAQDCIIGEGDVAADPAVVPHMGAGHEEATVADQGDPAAVLRAGAHGDALANLAVGPQHEAGRTAAVFDRLRRRPKRSEGIDGGARADGGMAGEVDMGHEPAANADRHVGSDDAIGPDRDVRCDRRSRFDPRCWIDHGHRRPHESMAPTSASATSCPATMALPRNHHMLFFRAILLM